MPDISTKWQDNVSGKFYIDQSCTFCCICMEEAPNNIKESPDGDHCIIFKQPENDDELAEIKSAMEGCPTESIGDDGE